MAIPRFCAKCDQPAPLRPGKHQIPMPYKELVAAGWKCVLLGQDDMWVCEACQKPAPRDASRMAVQ